MELIILLVTLFVLFYGWKFYSIFRDYKEGVATIREQQSTRLNATDWWKLGRFFFAVILVVLSLYPSEYFKMVSVTQTEDLFVSNYPWYTYLIFAIPWGYALFEWRRLPNSIVNTDQTGGIRKMGAILLTLLPLAAVENLSEYVEITKTRFKCSSLVIGKLFGPTLLEFNNIRKIELAFKDKETEIQFTVLGGRIEKNRFQAVHEAARSVLKQRADENQIPTVGL